LVGVADRQQPAVHVCGVHRAGAVSSAAARGEVVFDDRDGPRRAPPFRGAGGCLVPRSPSRAHDGWRGLWRGFATDRPARGGVYVREGPGGGEVSGRKGAAGDGVSVRARDIVAARGVGRRADCPDCAGASVAAQRRPSDGDIALQTA
jgi:hypothetical protein